LTRFKTVLLIFIILISGLSMAQAESSTDLKHETDKKVLAANQLLIKASALKQANDYGQALHLFIGAGQLLEQATSSYQSLLPDHATEQDVANAWKQMTYCVTQAKALHQLSVLGNTPHKKA